MGERLARLRAVLAERDLPAILVSNPQNRRYLSGFTGSAGFLAITADRAVLATDFRYVEQAGQQAPGFSVFRIERTLTPHFADLVRLLGVRRLAVESSHLTVAAFADLAGAATEAGAELVPVAGLVEDLRKTKDAAELAGLERAIAVADAAFAEVSRRIAPGMTERQVAWELEKHMREGGAEAVAFEIIVASGPNGALPHARPTDRPIGLGEPVVIDMGAQVNGYCSDMTRTIVLGEPDDTFRRVYRIVDRAQQAGATGIRPGMSGADADRLARAIIAGAGYGEQFGHGLGHGIGLAVHELPTLRSTSEDVLAAGMVFSVEPGIYLPGWGGVRIEDLVVLEAGGPRTLTRSAKLALEV
ncbi:MAG: aminopeptidase P family protein [Chloroflexi bacterium]|nr:aminopeptidase P family protein [Chloroflexota bacterium]